MKPLIGITPTPSLDTMGHGTFYRYCLSRTYTDSVIAAGGTPVILPTETQIEDILPRLDGLLLSGGGDLDPNTYGDSTRHETTYGVDPERDGFETRAFKWAVKHDFPTLCICRGVQVMAVAMGGALVQDIAAMVPGAIQHRQQEDGKMRDDLGHVVTLTAGTPLHDLMGGTEVMVNSFHHQAVTSVGPELEVIAVAPDGVVEGLQHPGMRFGIGVQWHPEMLSAAHPAHAAIFSGFVAAARTPSLV